MIRVSAPTRPHAVAALAFLGSMAATSAFACPDWSLQGTPISYGSEQLWAPQAVDVVAGGNVNLANCSMEGYGWVITQPDFDFNFSENDAGRELELRVEGSCDTVLLVNDASGTWHFNDDDRELNPGIRIPNAPAGAYDIWVGTYDQQTCQARLILETFGTPPGGASQGGASQGGSAGGDMQAMADPGNLTSYRDRVGQSFTFTVTGSNRGSVWGSDIYTDDSSLAAAAVHAGAIGMGETGPVTVTILPGQQSYQGTPANGISSSNYGSWSGSYQFVMPEAAVEPAPGNLTGYRDRVGQTFRFSVTGSDRGSVWGSGPYTDDSAVAVAAVHAGAVAVGETGVVEVRIVPGQQSYQGSTAHGVTSSNYGSWQGSYEFVGHEAAPAAQAPAAPSAGK